MYYLCHVQKGLAPPIEFDRENNHINHQKTKESREQNKTINRPTRKTNEDRKLSPPRKGGKQKNQKQNKSKKQKN